MQISRVVELIMSGFKTIPAAMAAVVISGPTGAIFRLG